MGLVKKKWKNRIKRLEEKVRDLNIELFGEVEIEFEPEPYLLDPNEETRIEILKMMEDEG